MKCPKCHSDNPDTKQFCGDCGTQLIPVEEAQPSFTKTLETQKEDLTRGSILADRYEIIEALGKGGMGDVYRVVDKKINEEVALKLLKPEITADKKTLERFGNELKLARKIVHKNVGRMYHLSEDKGTHFITMEYVPGQDLKALIRQSGQLAVGTMINIARQICDGLSEAHKLGVVHRDLKPSNIMIDREGNARIMDFGIARSLTTKGITGAGVIIGTPEYMSPEQVEGKEVDQLADIYSLGIILYEMVTGKVPFEGDTPLSIAYKHKHEVPQDPREVNPYIPEDLSSVVLKCLEKDKEKRYQSSDELHYEMENIEKSIPTTQIKIERRKPLTSREITVTFGLKKLFIPALVVIVLIIAAVIIWQLLPQREAVITPKIDNSIAIISFENLTGDKAYDDLCKATPDLLITNLEETGFFYVATWERMRDLLKQMGKENVEYIDSDLGFELCLREGIESLVTGRITKAGDMFAIDVKVLDVETKRLLKSANSKGNGADSIIKTQIDELSKEIAQGIGISREKIEAVQLQVADFTTSSMDAYKYFLKGKEVYQKLYYDEARQYFEKAIDLDPNFASAFLWLARAYSGLNDTRAREKAVDKAKALSNKVTEKEKLFIEAYYALYIEKNREKEFSLLQQLARKYPKEKATYISLGYYYLSTGDLEKAIEEFEKAVEIDPNWAVAMNALGVTYLRRYNSDFQKSYLDKAVEYYEKYASVSPGEANPLDSLAETYFRMGRLDEAISKYKEVFEIKPDFLMSIHNIQYVYAFKEDYDEAMNWVDKYISIAPTPSVKRFGYLWKGFYYYWLGSFEQSLLALERAGKLAEISGDDRGRAFVDWLKAWIYYDRGEYKLSRMCNEGWLDVFIESTPIWESFYKIQYSFTLGLIELKEGHLDLAKIRLEEMKALFPELPPGRIGWSTFYHALLQAEILLSEGSYDKAIDISEKSLSYGTVFIQWSEGIIAHNLPSFKDILARAYQLKGQVDNAIAEYELLINSNRESKDRFLIHPKYHYRVAKLYEEKGWKRKAIEHYEKFLSLWKDADPGIAEVEDAKKRLAGLQEERNDRR